MKIPPHSQNSSQWIPEKFKEAAQAMEEQFVQFMLEQMKKSVPKNEEESAAKNFYESLLTTEQAKRYVEQNSGQGLQKLILDQIYPEHLRNEINFNNFKNLAHGKNPYERSSME